MKRIVLIILVCLFLIFIFTRCAKKSYPFSQPLDNITSIEIVVAEDAFDYKVIKELSETERLLILSKLDENIFGRYVIGDPMEVYGDTIRIAYSDGSYEMICSLWNSYVSDGDAYLGWRYCDGEHFAAIINEFAEHE